MLQFGRNDTLSIPTGALLQATDHFEIIPPPELGSQLFFQVFCNGTPIGQARLEKVERSTYSDKPVLNLFDARHCPTYSLKLIQVSPHYRNRGIGTVLLKEILHYCKHHNIHRVTGELKDEMSALRQWLKDKGFVIVNDTWLEIQLA